MDSKVNVKPGQVLYNPNSNLFSLVVDTSCEFKKLILLNDHQDIDTLNLYLGGEYQVGEYFFKKFLPLSEIKIPDDIYISNNDNQSNIFLGFCKNVSTHSEFYLVLRSLKGGLNHVVNMVRHYNFTPMNEIVDNYYQKAPNKLKFKIKK